MPSENTGLTEAKKARKNEFYTLYEDIQKEINAYVNYNENVFRDKVILLPCDDPEWSNFTLFFAQNFEHFGLKKLISTSYAVSSKREKYHQMELQEYKTPLELNSPEYDEEKTDTHGKLYILDREKASEKGLDIDDIEWSYLEGDGDFRSEEVTKLRDEADMIITNPPFATLFPEYFNWVIESGKQFLMIANMNCITYKYVFPLIKNNVIWQGTGMGRWISGFIVPDTYDLYGTEARVENGKRIVSTNNCLWLTNIDHGKRHEVLQLMTMDDNLRYSKHKNNKKWKKAYKEYENYNAIEVPYTDAIPSDYEGVMGVPISFLDKYNPDQFELLWTTDRGGDGMLEDYKKPHDRYDAAVVDGEGVYKRILIRKKVQ